MLEMIHLQSVTLVCRTGIYCSSGSVIELSKFRKVQMVVSSWCHWKLVSHFNLTQLLLSERAMCKGVVCFPDVGQSSHLTNDFCVLCLSLFLCLSLCLSLSLIMMITKKKMTMMMMMIRMNVVPESRLLARRWAARPPDQGGAVSQRPIAQSL